MKSIMYEQQIDSAASSNQASEPIATSSSVEQRSDRITETSDEKDVYLTLVSAEREEFRVKREHALISGTIRTILSGPGRDVEEPDVIYLYEMPSRVLQKVCSYFEYAARYKESSDNPFHFVVEPDNALEMVMASTYLDC